MSNPYDNLRQRARYKVYYGGRGAGKSWAFARALILFANRWNLRILCVREYQNSIEVSVHRLLCDQIEALGLSHRFKITRNAIQSATGALFIFKGLHHNVREIKSLEGADICWVEEAQRVSKESWDILIPTIRKEGSEIWISFNPEDEDHPTWQRFVANPPPGAIVREVNYWHNRFLPDTLRAEMEHCRRHDTETYEHVWCGKPRKLGDALVLRGRYRIDVFDTPADIERFYYGADWGFAADPTTLVRCWIKDQVLYIDHEACATGIDYAESPQLFERVPGARLWPIRADSSRPETISAMRRAGFNVSAAAKWPGSIVDGIAHLRNYKEIVIHERCRHTAAEARLYSYKVDTITGDVLPIIVDRHNHCIDAIRYALDGLINRRGSLYDAI